MRQRQVTAAASLACAATLVLVPVAHADHEGTPTSRELLERCGNGTDSCVFHPEGAQQYFVAERGRVGEPAYNCTGSQQRNDITWSDTTSQSNSVGVSMTTEAKYAEVFSVSYEQSYKHTWENSHTESQQTSVITAPGEVGWIERGAQMERVKGSYELRFPDRFHGHYIWYVPFEIVGPAPDRTDALSPHVRKMTEAEKAACPK